MRVPSSVLCVILSVSFVLAPLSNLHTHLPATHSHDAAQAEHGHGHVHGHAYVDHHTESDHSVVRTVESHSHTHGGHLHFGSDEADEDHDILDLSIATMEASSKGGSSVQWLPIALIFTAFLFGFPRFGSFLHPPDPSPAPRQRNIYWRPPLRGPPALALVR